jgi:HlyD family secretion protein
VEVGDTVQPGQILAEIDAPDLHQQLHMARATLAQAEASVAQARSSLRQAKATLEHARAQLAHSRTTLARWRTLKERGLVAQQDLDDRQILVDAGRASLDAAQANVDALPASVAAAEANAAVARAQVERLVELQLSQQILAPSAGVVVARYVDVGGQVTSGSGSQNTPLFTIAPIDRLLVSVSLPSQFLASIKPGMTAELSVPEFPQRTFTAQVVAIGAVDPASKTFPSEMHLLDEEHVLRPGMHADVTLRLTQR